MKKFQSKMAAIALAALTCCGITSCKNLYYQVYDVSSNGLTQKDNALVYENGDLKVLYNLWDENGDIGFIVQNKSDKDLFIDMNQTFFIRNGIANDYFKNRQYTTTRTTMFSNGYSQSSDGTSVYWPMRYNVPATTSVLTKLTRGTSTAVTMKEKEYICIPGHATKAISEYKINPALLLTCNKKQDYPSQTASVDIYSESLTPLKFENRIAYSFSNNGEGLQYIENAFYISGIMNYSKKAAIKKVKEKANCYSKKKEQRKYFKIGGPSKFYQSYYKQNQ